MSLFYLNMTENSSYNSSEESKGTKTQNIADEQELQRFSGERPVSLGFELTFNPSLSESFGGGLTATRSVAFI